MKAISILQPWATLFAHGEKKYHSVNWTTDYRGEVAIFAHQDKSDYAQKMAMDQPIADLIKKLGYSYETLPFGVIIATANLISVNHSPFISREFTRQERKLNEKHYTHRYTFAFSDVVRLAEPIPAEGPATLDQIWDWQQSVPELVAEEAASSRPKKSK